MNKGVLALVAAFVAFWMYTSPDGFASFISEAGGGAVDFVGQLFQAVIKTVTSVSD